MPVLVFFFFWVFSWGSRISAHESNFSVLFLEIPGSAISAQVKTFIPATKRVFEGFLKGSLKGSLKGF